MNIREYLLVVDHAKDIDLIINNRIIGEIYNVDRYSERTNITIVNIVIAYLNENVDKEVTETLIKYARDRRYGIDSTKVKEELR